MPIPMEPSDYRKLAGLCRDRCARKVDEAEVVNGMPQKEKLVLDAADMLRAAAVFDERADKLEEAEAVDGPQ